jgi:hypothetical protein
MSVPEVPSCSIILATLSPWDDIRPLVQELLRQAHGVRGEVIVADGIGQFPTGNLEHRERLQWCPGSGLGVFDLRLSAVRRARGEIVIVTEDHCHVQPGWCEAIVDLHRRHPEVDVIKGTVRNGSTSTVIDRAGFAMLQWRNVPPVDQVEAARTLGINGSAFKRRSIDALLAAFPELPPELLTPAEIRRAGLRLLVDDTLTVTHVQSETWWRHGLLHYHNARAIGGQLRARAKRHNWMRLSMAPFLVPYRTGRALWQARKMDGRDTLLLAPAVTWLYLCKSAGELVGHVAGAGNSARRLH